MPASSFAGGPAIYYGSGKMFFCLCVFLLLYLVSNLIDKAALRSILRGPYFRPGGAPTVLLGAQMTKRAEVHRQQL